MRILHVSSHFYPKLDGTTRSIEMCVRGLAARGHEVQLLTKRFLGTAATETLGSVDVVRGGFGEKSSVAKLLTSVDQLRLATGLIRRRRIQIVHAHGFSSMLAGAFLKSTFCCRVVLSFHGFGTLWSRRLGWRRADEQILAHAFERLLLPFADKVLVWTEQDREIVLSVYGNSLNHRVQVVPHPVDTLLFSYAPPQVNDKPVVLFVGTLSRVHGAEVLVRAIPHVLAHFPHVGFVFAGKGPREVALRSACVKLGVSHKVAFRGFLKHYQLLKEYQGASIVVVPVIYEGGFPNVILEAMAVGRPVVTTLQVDPKLLRAGVFQAKRDDETSLAEAIVTTLRLPFEERVFLGNTARNFVEQHHSLDGHIDRLETIYSELVRN